MKEEIISLEELQERYTPWQCLYMEQNRQSPLGPVTTQFMAAAPTFRQAIVTSEAHWKHIVSVLDKQAEAHGGDN